MAAASGKRNRRQPSGSRTAATVLLLLIVGALACYIFIAPHNKPVASSRLKPESPVVKPVISGDSVTTPPSTATPPSAHKGQSDYPSTVQVPETEKSGTASGAPGRLAIIIDDMGSSVSEARLLTAIKVPLTFAIIPGLRADKEVDAYAATNKIETMIHVPMQPKGWPERRLETNGLLVTMDTVELQERVSGLVKQFPRAVGVNNHMGSEFTEQEEKVAAVLQTLKKNNLFFVDSVTSPESVCLKVAQRQGIRSARRNVFLDNEQEQGYILGQLNQAVRLARKNGSAIAICHPHPVTISTLAAALPALAGQGVHLVPVSQLVK